jgi:hypothetical protein
MSDSSAFDADNHPARGRASVPPPKPPSWRRWVKGIYQGALGAGALAGAVAAVLALRPPHDVEDAAAFKNVTITADVPFNEYQQRLVAPHSQANGLGRANAALLRADAVAHESPGPQVEIIPTPSGNEQTTSDGDHSNDTKSNAEPHAEDTSIFKQTEPPVSGAPTLVAPKPETSQAAAEWTRAGNEIEDACKKRLDVDFCKRYPRSIYITTDSDGTPITRAAAAKRQIAVLKTLRTTKVRGAKKPQPIGVVVVANVDLSGLRGKPVLLSWSMWRKDGGERLYGEWLNERLAYRIQATSDHDTGSVDFWIPLPKGKGPYFIRARLAIGDATLATSDSEAFI